MHRPAPINTPPVVKVTSASRFTTASQAIRGGSWPVLYLNKDAHNLRTIA
jgi:hypothetical protein